MALFAVIAINNTELVEKAVTEQYGANHFRFSQSSWFVPDTGTTVSVANKLRISNGALGANAVVLHFDAYSGFGPGTAWKWIAEQGGALSNG